MPGTDRDGGRWNVFGVPQSVAPTGEEGIAAGAAAMLRTLKARGFATGILSNGTEAMLAFIAASLASYLDAVGVERATFVGNSLGASIAWCLALTRPELCRALVMVDGFPPPKIAAPMRWLGLALKVADLQSAAKWFAERGFKLHFDPGMEESYFLIGRKQAMQMLLTGEMISAEDAVQFGLINAVVPQGHARTEALKLAAMIAAMTVSMSTLARSAFRITKPLSSTLMVEPLTVTSSKFHSPTGRW